MAGGPAHQRNNGSHHGPVVVAEAQPLAHNGGQCAGQTRSHDVAHGFEPGGALFIGRQPGGFGHGPRRPPAPDQAGGNADQQAEHGGEDGDKHALPERRLAGNRRDGSEGKDMEQRARRPVPPQGDHQRTRSGHHGGGRHLRPGARGVRQPQGLAGAGGQGCQQYDEQHERTGAHLDEEPLPVHLPAAVDSGEGAKGSKDCQVAAAYQDKDDQRNKDTNCAPDRDLMVLIAGGNREHLGEQLHGGHAFPYGASLMAAALASTPNPTPGA
ncbi:hypothetical protein D9M72_464230 [compost metagenome]